jgi:hypothetical protein
MSIAADLRTLMLEDASVAADVGAARIYPLQLPQNPALPAVTYFEVSAQRPYSSQQGPLKLCGSRFQIDAWALTFAEACLVAEKIRIRLDGYCGAVGDSTIQGIFLDNSRALYESEPKLYRVSRDYLIWFEETISA